jgi:hypothetical protein
MNARATAGTRFHKSVEIGTSDRTGRMSFVYEPSSASPIASVGGFFDIRDDLLPLFNERIRDMNGNVTSLHIEFERLDSRFDFDGMLSLLTKKDVNGYSKTAEFLACHVKNSDIPGFWNCLHPEKGIQYIKDIIPIAGAQHVLVQNLERRTDLNNKVGYVLGLVDHRFAVRIKCSDGSIDVLVHPTNLSTRL